MIVCTCDGIDAIWPKYGLYTPKVLWWFYHLFTLQLFSGNGKTWNVISEGACLYLYYFIVFTFLYNIKMRECERVWFVERKFSKFKTFFCVIFMSVWISELICFYHNSSISWLCSVSTRESRKKGDLKRVRRNSTKNEFREFRNERKIVAITLLCFGYSIFFSISPFPLSFFTHDTAI